ncbi:MAG TPA: hypothetical protein VFE33_28770 [Thermoanaerobaculia bacterium]|nr:hypothetical protein [Thermoanaerobaculia bacterium]
MQGAHLVAPFADPNARLLAFLVGAVLLVLGKRLFWLFVGIVGFLTVYRLSLETLHVHPFGVRLFLAGVAGLFGVLLALFVQRLAVGLAGFLVGAWFTASLLGLDPAHAMAVRGPVLLVVLAAGILAAFLALRLFDFALIALSALAGAGLITDAAHVAAPVRTVLLVLLAVAGIAIQAGWTGRRARAR